MLVNTTVSSAEASAPITIVVGVRPANSIMYTVPSGRKFVGYILTGMQYNQPSINNVGFYAWQQNQNGAATNLYTLYGGAVIKEGSNASQTTIIGTETAA